MPGSDYSQLSDKLRRAGLQPSTPCLVVSRAGSRDQQVLWTDVARLAVKKPLPSPALLIVGHSVLPGETVEGVGWQLPAEPAAASAGAPDRGIALREG
jgi:siroheme synthase